MNVKPGDEVVVVSGLRTRRQGVRAQVLTVGRKWFTVERQPRLKFLIEDGTNSSQYMDPVVWTIEEWEGLEEREILIGSLRDRGIKVPSAVESAILRRIAMAIEEPARTEHRLVIEYAGKRTIMARGSVEYCEAILKVQSKLSAPRGQPGPRKWYIQEVEVAETVIRETEVEVKTSA